MGNPFEEMHKAMLAFPCSCGATPGQPCDGQAVHLYRGNNVEA